MNIKRLLEASRNGAVDTWAHSVLWKDSPSPPPPPDYAGAAQAQGAANVDTAIAEGILNRPNQISPYGNITYNQVGSYTTPGGQVVPRFESVTSLSPSGQQQFDQQQRISSALGGLAESSIGRVGQTLGTPFNMGNIPPQAQASETARQAVINAMISRQQPVFDRTRTATQNDLMIQGHNPGGQAWNARTDDLNRAENDYRLAAEQAGGAEQSRLYGLESDARSRAIQEQAFLRSLPLNEVNALRSGQTIGLPQFQQGPQSQIAPAPIFNAAQQGYGAQLNNYNAQVGAANSANQGLFGLGSAAISTIPWFMSDVRLKSNIQRVGTHPLGIGIYEYDIFGHRERGVIAQELMAVKPDAVGVHSSGYLMVNYGAL
jgi:hypothetical protein